MKIISFVKGGLFVIEFFRIIILAIILITQENNIGLSIIILFAAPCVLFPIMALFIWLDTGRYRAFIPLFIAGKCVSIFMILGWFIMTWQVTMIMGLILSVDFFAFALILMVNNDSKKPAAIR